MRGRLPSILPGLGFDTPPHHLDRAGQAADALQRVELALQRHQHLIRRDQRVQRQQSQAGRAIDQDGAERRGLTPSRQGVTQAELAPRLCRQFNLGAHQVGAGRHQPEVVIGGRVGFHRVGHAFVDQPVAAKAAVLWRDTEAGRGVALGVEVDQQHRLPCHGQGGGQVDGRGGLAHAPLLVGDGENARLVHRVGGGIDIGHGSPGNGSGKKTHRHGPRVRASAARGARKPIG